MKIGILSDTHDAEDKTKAAISIFKKENVELIVHCGDLTSPEIVKICSELPFYFVFGNHDSDRVRELTQAAKEFGADCLHWGGFLPLDNVRIAVCHGHMTKDLRPLLDAEPDYLFSGHSHQANVWQAGSTTRINPGALFRATRLTVSLLDLATERIESLEIEK